jgi:hypothetical protein
LDALLRFRPRQRGLKGVEGAEELVGKRQVGLLRMLQAGVILSDYATLMVEILKDNARSEAGEVYGAMDMAWAKLVGQIAHAYGK